MEQAISYSFGIDQQYDVFVIDYVLPGESKPRQYDVGPPYTLLNPLIGNTRYPAILHHLSHKSWVSPAMLYDLAAEIQQRFPDHPFDWHQTFHDLEFAQHVRTVFGSEEPAPKDRTGTDLLTSERERTEYRQRAVNDVDLQQRLSDEVTRKLQAKGLSGPTS